MDSRSQRIRELEEQIQDIKDIWPAHSVRPWMLQQLEELEDELAALLQGETYFPEDAQSSSTQ